VSGNRIRPVHRCRRAAQQRLKHRHHLVGLGALVKGMRAALKKYGKLPDQA
jgi:hypothetical protein